MHWLGLLQVVEKGKPNYKYFFLKIAYNLENSNFYLQLIHTVEQDMEKNNSTIFQQTKLFHIQHYGRIPIFFRESGFLKRDPTQIRVSFFFFIFLPKISRIQLSYNCICKHRTIIGMLMFKKLESGYMK